MQNGARSSDILHNVSAHAKLRRGLLIILLISLYLIISLNLPFRQRNLGEEIFQTLALKSLEVKNF